MIYTLTLNPAIDYVAHVEKLKVGSINRSHSESVFFGGKGINVSTVLHELGINSTAMGFVAGFTGKAIEEGLKNKGIETDFVHLENGFSRINIKLREENETDINGQGPEIEEKDIIKLLEKLDRVQDGDTVVLAGSIPSSLPNDTYERIMQKLKSKNVRFAVDATGELLLNTLKYRPFLIKPNNDELGEIYGVEIKTQPDALVYAEKIQSEGARNVLVTMGGKGAILLDENGNKYYVKAHEGKVVNTVGAGDSTVAGFLAGYEKTGNYEYALKLGSASGSATAFSEGLADIETIQAILNS